MRIVARIQYVESSAPDEDLKTGRILLAISEIQADNSKQTSKPLRICLTYNMSAAASSSTYSMVKQLLETANIQIAYERLYACGVQDSVFENIVLTEKTVNNNFSQNLSHSIQGCSAPNFPVPPEVAFQQ